MPKPNRNVPPTIQVSLLDQTFGEWTVIGFAGRAEKRTPKRAILWLCRCSCGRTAVVHSGNLRGGRSTKCRTCGKGGPPRIHESGYTPPRPINKAWAAAEREGFCKAWQNVDVFVRDMAPKPPRAKLTRRNDSKPHSPKNSYWHTRQDTIREQVDELMACVRPATKAAEKRLREHLANCTKQHRHALLKRARRGEPIFRRADLIRRFELS